jgi:hypothetical protein
MNIERISELFERQIQRRKSRNSPFLYFFIVDGDGVKLNCLVNLNSTYEKLFEQIEKEYTEEGTCYEGDIRTFNDSNPGTFPILDIKK